MMPTAECEVIEAETETERAFVTAFSCLAPISFIRLLPFPYIQRTVFFSRELLTILIPSTPQTQQSWA
jgi:hypothetical protein